MSHHRMHPYNYNNVSYNNHPQYGQDYEADTTQENLPEEESPAGDLPMPEDQETQDETLQSEENKPGENKQETSEPVQDTEAVIKDMRLRMAAEMDNYKKRLDREHQEQMRFASEKVLSDLLPALDNLDLALQYASNHEACHDMMQGIEMTRKQLQDAIGKHGLVAVGKRGEEFNPAIHEAIGMDSDPELQKGAVSKVMQPGYKLNDRLLRPAKVMVNN